jgi:hypothetical protein
VNCLKEQRFHIIGKRQDGKDSNTCHSNNDGNFGFRKTAIPHATTDNKNGTK